MTFAISGCAVEIDHERGIISVHSPRGGVIMRITGLPTPVPEVHLGQVVGGMMEISDPRSVSWSTGGAAVDAGLRSGD